MSMSRVAGTVFLAALCAFAAPASAANPSFDCAKASTAVERLLCADDGLARQDRLLAATYRKALSVAGPTASENLRRDQRAWARGRATACPEVEGAAARRIACLADIYAARIDELRPLSFGAMHLLEGVDVQADRRSPLVCLRFDAPVAAKQPAALESYVAGREGETLAVRLSGGALCVEGFAHGERRELTVRAGLYGEGAILREDATIAFDIPDRPRRIAFPSNGLILPRVGAAGLPIEGVNVAAARVLILRVDDRDVVDGLRRGLIERQISYADVGRIASRIGQNVWTGEVEIGGERNVATKVAIPVGEVAPDLQPGVYLAVAEDPEAERAGGWWATSQWFVVSDIGLTAFKGEDALTVLTRRLSDASPTPGVEIALQSATGAELARSTTDAGGVARFPSGLLRGEGDAAAHAVYAYGEGGEFVYLDLTRAPVDLSDRGVDGRPAAGALDAYVTTERGVYRPGGRVYLTALLRDWSSAAVAGLPLTLKVVRSDGLEVERRVLRDKGAGGYGAIIAIAESAPTGMWRATLHADPDGAAVGAVRFLVDDFVPPLLEATATASLAGEAARVEVAADFLYGAPAGGLTGEATLDVRVAANPAPGHEGFVFGPATEERPPRFRAATQRFVLDDDGKQTLDLPLAVEPSPFPLEGVLRATVFEPGGRPAPAETTLLLENQPLLVGVKPLFADGGIAEGGVAAFEIAAFDGAGAPVARSLEYSIVREEPEYIWFQENGRWDYHVHYTDRETIDVGALDVAPDAFGRVERRFEDWGGYRLDVTDKATGVLTSVRFRAGWWGGALAGVEPQPDKVKVTLPSTSFQPGEQVDVLIEPPYAGVATVVVADGSVRSIETAEIPAEGGVVQVEMPANGAAGAYVLVTLHAEAEGVRSLAPRRSIGAAWAAFDKSEKALTVDLTFPETASPSGLADVRVRAAGVEGPAYVVLSAVDDGVLGLTGHESPDPVEYFLGKRRLGVEMRDVYGRLIDAAGARAARVRSGGDAAEAANVQLGNLPKKSVEVTALFSGVVELNAEGEAVIPLDLPEFAGRLRLMAQAWSGKKVGGAEGEMLVRRPLAATFVLPRFLSPGDAAEATVALRNVSGPAGEYAARLTVEGPLGVEGDADFMANLAAPGEAGAAVATSFDLTAINPGDARLRLEVSGPDGMRFAILRTLSVRPAAPFETRRHVASVGPGETLRAPPALFEGLYPGLAQTVVGLNPLPDLDLPSVLAGLSRYPYGCAEQTTSTASPMLFARGLSAELGLRPPGEAEAAVKRGVDRLIGMQTFSGGFGFWDNRYEAEPWITVYATDFLVRARLAGHTPPERPLARALDRLSRIVDEGVQYEPALPAAAYALYVRALAGVADPARARRFAAALRAGGASALTLRFAAAGLARLGDLEGAGDLFRRAARAEPSPERGRFAIYASPIRDRAAGVALMAESGLMEWPDLAAEAEALSRAVRSARYLSTQEQAWLVRAGAALNEAAEAKGFAVEIDGEQIENAGAAVYRTSTGVVGTPALRNLGDEIVAGIVSVVGAPVAPPPATDEGFHVERRLYDRRGRRLNPEDVRQNDVVVVVLEGEQTAVGRARALLVDFLPAGFELENARLGGEDLGAFAWLEALTTPQHVELRDDRFVAAFDSTGGRAFKVAYLARAVTPGRFAHGGAKIEAMYQPEQFGRSAANTVTVSER